MTKQRAGPFENFPKPAQRALEAAGYTELKQLSNVSDSELLKLHGFGHEGLMLLKETLEQAGLSTADRPQGAQSAPDSAAAKTGRNRVKVTD